MYLKKETKTILVFLSIPFFLGIAADASPGEPALSHTTGNFWVNYAWSAGENTDSFNVSVNGNWTNGTTSTYSNTSVGPHGRVFISVAGYNAASQQLSNPAIGSAQVPNNQITLTNVSSSYILYEGQTLYISPGYTDADGDKGTFATTATKGTFDSSSGILSWKTGGGDRGIYNWQIRVTDGYGSVSQFRFTVTVKPNTGLELAYTTGTSWVNYTWSPFPNANSYNVSINGIWSNGSNELFKNITGSPHEWVNISVAGYNELSGPLLDFGFVSMSTQIPDNPITLTGISDKYFLNEVGTLYISPGYTDSDGDTGVFATNASCVADAKCTFDPSTGILSWTIGPEDSGTYNWYINVTDRYGSVSTQEFRVIVPLNFGVRLVEPNVVNDNGIWVEKWNDARVGHIGKLIGIDGIFNNTGEDLLKFTVTDNPGKYCETPCTIIISPGQSKSFMEAFNEEGGRYNFEIKPAEVNSMGFFNYTMNISVTGYSGSNPTFNYYNTTALSLPIVPISRMKRADGNIAVVVAGGTTKITYTLEANSSINLTNVSIYDPFYPADQKGPYFNISRLEVNGTQSTCWEEDGNITPCQKNFTYLATTGDLSKFKCIGEVQCVINTAAFTGKTGSGELISDTDFVRIFEAVKKPDNTRGSSRSGGSSGSGGGGGSISSDEDYSNIKIREVREMDVLAKSASVYIFKAADPVMSVSFESSVSENEVPVAVEILNNRSKRVETDAPGKLYQYFNVFVGTSGFNNKVSNGVVVYRVNNSWLEENGLNAQDISLYKWEGTWVKKSTEIAQRTQNHTYYAGLAGNFSRFAIAGINESEATSAPDLITDNSSEPGSDNSSAPSKAGLGAINLPVSLNTIIWVTVAIGVISAVYYFKKIRAK